jgi:ribonuclease HI
MENICIYSDGACSGNPGPGGWGYVIVNGAAISKEVYGHDTSTTNNKMEMMGAIRGLESFPSRQKINLYTDSNYLKNGITDWSKKWQRNGWKTADGKDVKNKDLWERLVILNQVHDVSWNWVKGHSTDPLNQRADKLAVQGRDEAKNFLANKNNHTSSHSHNEDDLPTLSKKRKLDSM